MSHTGRLTRPLTGPDGGRPRYATVWPTAQQPPQAQRRGRYVPESTPHPARMLPAIARHAIDAYTEPGELVLDPMCGIGTTLVEAAHAGRDAIGVEYEPRWADLADANIAHARPGRPRAGAGCRPRRRHPAPDARPAVLPGRRAGAHLAPVRADRARPRPAPARRRRQVRQPLQRPRTPATSAHRDLPGLVDGFAEILPAAAPCCAPAAPWWSPPARGARTANWSTYPARSSPPAPGAGLVPVDACVALLAAAARRPVRRPALVLPTPAGPQGPRPGLPLQIIAHEDVLLFQTGEPNHSLIPPRA